MAKPDTQKQSMKIVDAPSTPAPKVKYVRMSPHVENGKVVPGKWDLFEGEAEADVRGEKKLENGFDLPTIRAAYDVARARRHFRRVGDPA